MLDHTLKHKPSGHAWTPKLVDVVRCGLRVEAGPDAGRVCHPLNEQTLIGREPWCDLPLSDPHVSGQHVEITLAKEGVRIRDLGSTNGTFCGGMRLLDGYLPGDAVLNVGDTSLRLFIEGGAHVVERSPIDPSGTLVGSSESMQRLFGMMKRLAPREIAVLLLGETGTGKTAVARAMHAMSARASKPFVSINCAAFPPDLAESTLFGHVKGAFTGAHRASAGIFEQAAGGSVLLDEVGEMPLQLQAKLLQALETRQVRPVGGEQEIAVDFRLFSATNRKLRTDVAEGRFRQDLYFRLAGIDLEIPPLRDRIADVPDLARWLVGRAAKNAVDGASVAMGFRLSDAAMRVLCEYSWPGNVRELENVIDRAVALADYPLLEADDILLTGPDMQMITPSFLAYPPAPRSTAITERPPPMSDAAPPMTFREFRATVLTEHERSYFRSLMEQSGGNISRAAQLAGLSRTWFKMELRKHELL